MANWAAITLATMTLLSSLAGCVKPIEDEPEPDPCHGWAAKWCTSCDGCDHPPPVVTPSPTPYPVPPCGSAYNATPHGHERVDLVAFQPACPDDPALPLLGHFTPRLLLEDCACENASLAYLDGQLFVATEAGLILATQESESLLAWPTPMRAPHVALGRDARVFAVGLEDAGTSIGTSLGMSHGHARALNLVEYADAGFTFVATLDLARAPMLALAQRAWVAQADGALVVILDTGDAAWSIRHDGSDFRAPELLTPMGGSARVGAPIVEARGRVLVPFAFTPRDPLHAISSLLTPAGTQTSLHFAALADGAGAWTLHGGMVVPQGARSAPALETGERGAMAMSWVEASGALVRIEAWDDGGSWSSAGLWSEPRARVVGAPAAARHEHRATLAWWEDDGSLLVGRTDGMPVVREVVGMLEAPRAQAALALTSEGRAVVVWVDENGDVWAGIEGGTLPAHWGMH